MESSLEGAITVDMVAGRELADGATAKYSTQLSMKSERLEVCFKWGMYWLKGAQVGQNCRSDTVV